MTRNDAILLLGPTGSGKSPLGEHLAKHGYSGRRCMHFDFGEHLRRARLSGPQPTHFSAADISVIARVLDDGALLEDDQFQIAAGIYRLFAETAELAPDDLVILNGLPRHSSQAEDMDALVEVQLLIVLQCTPEVVRERIQRNTGADRTHRADDSPKEIARKLELYEARTQPLVNYYEKRGADIRTVEIGPSTLPEQIYDMLFSG